MQKGDRVNTAWGPGTVAYVRMASPDYTTVDAVSVVLDSKRTRPGYSGTIVAPADLRPDDG